MGDSGGTESFLADLETNGRIEYNSTIGSVCISRIDDSGGHLNTSSSPTQIIDDSEDDIIAPHFLESYQEEEELSRKRKLDLEAESPTKKSRRPKQDLDPERQVSNNLVDSCTSSCNLCGKIASHDSILKHISNMHKASQKDNYVMLTRSYYKCRICDSEMVFFIGRIKEHLKRTHKITLNEYKFTYNELTEKIRFGRRESTKTLSRCNFCSEIFSHEETIEHIQNVHDVSFENNFEIVTKQDLKVQVSEKRYEWAQEQAQEIIELWKHTLDDGVMVFTDNAKEKCLRQCELCQKIYSDDSLRNHIRLCHKDEDRRHPKEHKLVKITYHRCRLCEKPLRFTFNIVSKHLKKMHSLKFNEYKERCSVFLEEVDEESSLLPQLTHSLLPNLTSSSLNPLVN